MTWRTQIGKVTPVVDFDRELKGLFDLTGKVAFLPGGYGGLGEAIAWGLAQRGAADRCRRPRAPTRPRTWRRSSRPRAIGNRRRDGRDARRQIRRSVDRSRRRFGAIDILVNCVGIQIEQPLAEVTEEAFDQVYASTSRRRCSSPRPWPRHQVAAGRGGKQMHLLSVRAQLGLRDRGYSAYCSTKGGLVMLIKQHAMELAPHQITVNGVAPTFVYTEMIRHVMENPAFRQQL